MLSLAAKLRASFGQLFPRCLIGNKTQKKAANDTKYFLSQIVPNTHFAFLAPSDALKDVQGLIVCNCQNSSQKFLITKNSLSSLSA